MWGFALAASVLLQAPAAKEPTIEKPAATATTDAEALTAQVRKLVRDLDANELATRDSAEQKLFDLGPKALRALPPIGERQSDETRVRLERVVKRLQQAESERAALPSNVTLKVENEPLADVLAELQKQTGNRLIDYRQAFGQEVEDIRISIELTDKPFWLAMDQLLDENGLTIYGYGGERALYVVARGAGERSRAGQGAVSGPFRFLPRRFEATRDLLNPKQHALRLALDIIWEPRLRPVMIRQPLSDIAAELPDGEKLAVVSEEGEIEVSVNDTAAMAEMVVGFELPERNVASINKIRGSLNVLLPGPDETFRFAALPIAEKNKPVKPLELRQAGVMVAVDQVRKNNEVWEVAMRVKFEKPGKSLESHRAWIYNNDAYLVGPDKKRIDHGGYEQTLQEENEVGLTYLFTLDKGPKDLAFVYKTPTTINELPVAFELKDLKLP